MDNIIICRRNLDSGLARVTKLYGSSHGLALNEIEIDKLILSFIKKERNSNYMLYVIYMS